MKKKTKVTDFTSLLNLAEFKPTEEMLKAKQKVMARMESSPMYSSLALTSQLAFELTTDQRFKKWATVPGFEEWLSNRLEYREKLTSLIDKAMDRADEILSSRSERAYSAQVSLIKIMLEAGGKMPKGASNAHKSDSEAAVAAMSEEELDKLLKSAGYVRPTLANIEKRIPMTLDVEETGGEDD